MTEIIAGIQERDAFLRAKGITMLYDFQKEALKAWEERRDALITLPTGRGKSLCYQLPSLGSPGLTLVISPLVVLMQDQVVQLQKAGVRAEYLCALKSEQENTHILHHLTSFSFLYITPERTKSNTLRHALRNVDLKAIVVDEAHCVSLWGRTFRSSYRQLKNFLALYPKARRMALSATVTPQVKKDILSHLCLRHPVCIEESPFRKDISLHLHAREDVIPLLIRLLSTHMGGVIYVQSRYACEYLGFLLSKSFSVEIYHAGLDKTRREDVLHRFLSGQVLWVVATSAFGMGIDKPDIRTIIHIHPPPSIEDYLQQIGRASRDGGGAQAHLIFSPSYLVSSQKRHALSFSFVLSALLRGKLQLIRRMIYENRLWKTILLWIGEGFSPAFLRFYFSGRKILRYFFGISFDHFVDLLQGRSPHWMLAPCYGKKRGIPLAVFNRWIWGQVSLRKQSIRCFRDKLWVSLGEGYER